MRGVFVSFVFVCLCGFWGVWVQGGGRGVDSGVDSGVVSGVSGCRAAVSGVDSGVDSGVSGCRAVVSGVDYGVDYGVDSGVSRCRAARWTSRRPAHQRAPPGPRRHPRTSTGPAPDRQLSRTPMGEILDPFLLLLEPLSETRFGNTRNRSRRIGNRGRQHNTILNNT